MRRIAGGLLVGCLVAILAVVLKPDPPVIECLTADGQYRIRFLAADAGGIDYSSSSRAWVVLHELLSNFGPTALSSRLPPPARLVSRDQTALNGARRLCLLFEVIPAHSAAAPKTSPPFRLEAEFEDSHGYRFRSRSIGYLQAGTWNGLMFDHFPRRDPRLTIRLMDNRPGQELLTFQIPNPGYEPDAPQWKPQPVPQVASSDTLEVTVRGVDAATLPRRQGLELELKALSPLWENATTITEFEDATGNVGFNLSPFEDAWKARVEVVRSPNSGFGPTEQWSTAPVPPPDPGQRIALQAFTTLNGCVVRVSELRNRSFVAASGSTSPAKAGSSPVPRPIDRSQIGLDMLDSEFVFDITGLTNSATVLQIVKDQHGQVLKHAEMRTRTRTGRNGGMTGEIRFPVKPDTTKVTLTTIIHESQTFEFLVAPPESLKVRSQDPETR